MKKLFLITCIAFSLCACGASDDQLIQLAIQQTYPGIYDDLSDLQEDYPGFTPEVKVWGSIMLFLLNEVGIM